MGNGFIFIWYEEELLDAEPSFSFLFFCVRTSVLLVTVNLRTVSESQDDRPPPSSELSPFWALTDTPYIPLYIILFWQGMKSVLFTLMPDPLLL